MLVIIIFSFPHDASLRYKSLSFKRFPNNKFYIDSSKLEVFGDDNFELDENGGIFSKRRESTVGKGEIARYEQFLLFPQCFQKT